MHFRSFGLAGLAGIGVVLSGIAPSHGASLSDLARHVTSFQLANGMKFAVLERRESPMVSIHMVVQAGPLDETPGQPGISRLFPRMFTNGGDLGTRNPAAEKAALARVEQAYDLWKKLEAQKPPADSYDVSKARVDFQMASENAAVYSTPGFAFRVLEEAGAMTVETRVEADAAHYIATLPAHSAEVWFKLVSDWMRKPSTRRFYTERNAWIEEMNKSVQTSPQTSVEDALLTAAFGKSGYGRKSSAMSDGSGLRVSDFDAFARTNYVAANSVISIAGDLAPAEARRLAETYFGQLPRAASPAIQASAPVVWEEDRIANARAIPGATTPVVIGWPRPPRTDPDDAVFDVIFGLLTAGQDAELPRTFEREKVPAQGSAIPNFPGDRDWSLFAVSAFPAGPVTREAVEAAVSKAVSSLGAKPVEAARLARVKLMLRTQLASEAESINGASQMLARFLSSHGSIAAIGEADMRIEKVTPADVERVAKKYLREKGRVLLRPQAETAGGGL